MEHNNSEHNIQVITYDDEPVGIAIDGVRLMSSETCINMSQYQGRRIDRAIGVAVAALVCDFILLGLLIFMILTV